MNWYLAVLKKYAVFNGRARLKEYWYFFLFNALTYFALTFADIAFGLFDKETSIGLLSTIYWLAVAIPGIAVAVRRLHDIGRSGWWLLIVFIPLIGGIILLIFAIRVSQPGDNQYGPNPIENSA